MTFFKQLRDLVVVKVGTFIFNFITADPNTIYKVVAVKKDAEPRSIEPRKSAVAFGPIEVEPKSTAEVKVPLEKAFLGKKLINTGSSELLLDRVYVGSRAQGVIGGPVKMKSFDNEADNNEIDLEACNPGQTITLFIQNADDKPQRFSATLFGRS